VLVHRSVAVRGGFAAFIVFVALACLLVAPAAAHITVNPSEAPQGSFSKLTFRVPNERDDASTTKVEVTLPEDVAIPFVSVQPTPGWTAQVERRTLDTPMQGEGGEITDVVSKITWTGGSVNPGEFQEFSISAGTLPTDQDQMEFPAIQTYSSGEVVRWIEEPAADGEEAEHPVPTLKLVAAESETDATGATGDGDGGGAEAASATTSDDDGTDALTIVALVVGAVGVMLGGLALMRGRAATSSTPPAGS
jgi:uncharacterized protein YcnI